MCFRLLCQSSLTYGNRVKCPTFATHPTALRGRGACACALVYVIFLMCPPRHLLSPNPALLVRLFASNALQGVQKWCPCILFECVLKTKGVVFVLNNKQTNKQTKTVTTTTMRHGDCFGVLKNSNAQYHQPHCGIDFLFFS